MEYVYIVGIMSTLSPLYKHEISLFIGLHAMKHLYEINQPKKTLTIINKYEKIYN